MTAPVVGNREWREKPRRILLLSTISHAASAPAAAAIGENQSTMATVSCKVSRAGHSSEWPSVFIRVYADLHRDYRYPSSHNLRRFPVSLGHVAEWRRGYADQT